MDSANQGQSWKAEKGDFEYLVDIQEILIKYGGDERRKNPKEVLRRIGLIIERWNPKVVKMNGNYLIGKKR